MTKRRERRLTERRAKYFRLGCLNRMAWYARRQLKKHSRCFKSYQSYQKYQHQKYVLTKSDKFWCIAVQQIEHIWHLVALYCRSGSQCNPDQIRFSLSKLQRHAVKNETKVTAQISKMSTDHCPAFHWGFTAAALPSNKTSETLEVKCKFLHHCLFYVSWFLTQCTSGRNLYGLYNLDILVFKQIV